MFSALAGFCEFDALRIVYNKFQSVVQFLPTVATILSPEVVEKESNSGGKLGDLDSYKIEGGETKEEIFQNRRVPVLLCMFCFYENLIADNTKKRTFFQELLKKKRTFFQENLVRKISV